VAVRPERVAISAGDQGDADCCVSGTVAQVVYLGTLTQFHVDTSLGKRLIVHRLSDDGAAEVREGDQVMLGWSRDDTSILHQPAAV
jgi:ABC-type Fe3+/spermidine/putrescine transport system ATPase subunit